jgi:hypothetical protein
MMIGPLVVAKAGDAITTILGLTLVPGLVETNPAVRLVIDHAGVAGGVLLATALSIAVVVAVTETGFAVCRRLAVDEGIPSVVRMAGYYPAALVFGATAAYNAALILRVGLGV